MNFNIFVSKIKKQFTKEQLAIFNSIHSYKKLHLANKGENDDEGYQIFTPDFIVKDMCSAVGDDLLVFSKNILEPTSGDGAFTTYIFKKRLETIEHDFEIESLKALSTIYSVEMDKKLIERQRNNIYTLARSFMEKKGVSVDESYFEILKCIITTNFMWAMFNSDRPIDAGLFGTELAYKMPEAEKRSFCPINMPVWEITNGSVDYHEEEVDLW